MEQFVINNVQYALSLDDKDKARPMTSNVLNPDAINAVFDYRVYSKG